jgi:hypothetical protein
MGTLSSCDNRACSVLPMGMEEKEEGEEEEEEQQQQHEQV